MVPYPSLFSRALGLLCALAGLPLQVARGDDVYLELGANAQSIVDAHPAGTRYIFRAGVHRAVRVVPKNGDTISGEPGAVLNGCLQLPEWTREGEGWLHLAPVLLPEVGHAGLGCSDMICAQRQDLYVNNHRLEPVRSMVAVTDDSTWFLDRARGAIYMRRDPTGLEVEFGGPAGSAIDCAPLGQLPRTDVIIEDLKIEKYPCGPQGGQVRLAAGCICRRCDSGWSHGYGVEVRGRGTVQDCYLHHNGQCGVGGSGAQNIIERCEMAYNGWPFYLGLAWDDGGIKLGAASDSIVRQCYVHHNKSVGIWFDVLSTTSIAEDNIVEFNDWEGILLEISHHLTARRNICRWNGLKYRGASAGALWGGQICVQNARDLEIESNYLEGGLGLAKGWGSSQGIMIFNQNPRIADQMHLGGDFSVRNLNIHHNLIVTPTNGHNGIDDGTLGWDTYEEFLSSCSWTHNRYLTAKPLSQLWSWRLQESWTQNGAFWMPWEQWLQFQDTDSVLETFSPEQYQPTAEGQWALIQQVTGHDYPAYKAGLIRRPPLSLVDADTDGLPDEWETDQFGSLERMPNEDGDGDGWDNATEYREGSNPRQVDTDEDGIPDQWEGDQGLNPRSFDSELDADLDGRSALEEYEDGTDPAIAQPIDQRVPESDIAFWMSTTSGLKMQDDRFLEWIEHSPARRELAWSGSPAISAVSPGGAALVTPASYLTCLGAEDFWGTAADGFTLTFVYQPTAIDLSRGSRGILTNEHYLTTGFRLQLVAGYLMFNSNQSGGNLTLAGHTRLEAGRTYVISVVYSGAGGRHAVYLDGGIEVWESVGIVVPSVNRLMLGNISGVVPQQGLFGDVVVFARYLSHLERRSVERLLKQKFQAGFAAGPDRDLDGMPDEYELEHRLDPATPDGQGDEDHDALVNLREYESGTDPQRPDTDGESDGMPDAWEIDHGLDPMVDDATGDLDSDGANNLTEFTRGLNPEASDSDQDQLPDGWEIDNELDPRVMDAGGDPDGDGATNLTEFERGLDAQASDTDQDGMPDGWELNGGLDPLVDDAAGDPDGDGETNLDEFERGLDPQALDTDQDGMADGWESNHGLNPLVDDADGDLDGDGATNLTEFGAGTEPEAADSDQDAMPDGWELNHGLDPLVDDAAGDPDGDGQTNLTEFEEGADPQHTTTIPPALDFVRLRLWWRSEVGLVLADDTVARWIDSSAQAHDGLPAVAAGGPAVSAQVPGERRLVVGSPSGLVTAGEVDLTTLRHLPGVTLLAVVRTPALPGAAGVFQPILAAGGVLLGSIDGKLAAHSGSNGVSLASSASQPAGEVTVVSLTLPLLPGKARLYADGELLAEGGGFEPVLSGRIQLGGHSDAWSAEVGEVMVFAGVLSHRDRQLAERVLAGKWQDGGALAGDSDGDALPDWWEWEAATDPAIDDAALDADLDGLSNLAAFQQGRSGFVWKDEDADGLHDRWEIAHGLDPSRDDAALDLDGDTLSNAIEHALGTRPDRGEHPSGAWEIVPTGHSVSDGGEVRVWNNHHSWKECIALEISDSLAPGSWRLLQTVDPSSAARGGISRTSVPIPRHAASAARFFRLRLLNE